MILFETRDFAHYLGEYVQSVDKRGKLVHSHRTTLEGDFGYTFNTHFHPYAPDLLRSLLAPGASKLPPGVPALQAEDTRYVDAGGGAWDVVPGSTRVRVPAPTDVTLPNGGDVRLTVGDTVSTLAAGDTITLVYGATFAIPDGTLGTYDGDPAASLTGTLVRTTRATRRIGDPKDIPYEGAVLVAGGTLVTLPMGTPLLLAGGAQATLVRATVAALTANQAAAHLGGLPLPALYDGAFFATDYVPSALVDQPYPVKELEFGPSFAHGVYSAEVFYHAPFAIAVHLARNQRFAEAQRWFHLIFDPTDNSDGPVPERFWRVKAFQFTDAKKIEDIVLNVSTGADPVLQQETLQSIAAWKRLPFRPHAVARYRHTAYMMKTVTAYLDLLLTWGDSLYRQDTRESVNEAMQLYVLAAGILGPRPQAVPRKGTTRVASYSELRERNFDAFGNVLVEMEHEIPFDSMATGGDAGDTSIMGLLAGNAQFVPYFCIPRNDRLMRYWDVVALRLYNIRHSLNIRGIFRQLPLWEPPIDPALLAKGAAAGLDIGAIVSGASQPLPLVRFQFLVQKASELCQQVQSLGAGLLAALEKEDNESLALLRARHESVVLGLVEMVRYSQLQDALKSKEGLDLSLESAKQRYKHYERLLGEKEADIDAKLAEQEPLDVAQLEKLKLRSAEPGVDPREIEIDISPEAADAAGGAVKSLSAREVEELGHLERAQRYQNSATLNDMLSSLLGLIPDFAGDTKPMGVGAGLTVGGKIFSRFFGMLASVDRAAAGAASYQAGQAAKIGGYERRAQDWSVQSNLAAAEIGQARKQLRAAEIRTAIAEREWKSHKQQMEHARQVEEFLRGERAGKKTSVGFYAWMKREAKALHAQSFELAFDTAKKAERALQHELGDASLSYLQYGYLSGKEGLLAGEKLQLDIKRMEMAYYELNEREYELTKHVSLLQVAPLALMELRLTGRCEVELPEELFDLDCPGHYFRRIKSVALSVPCVAGPYSGVNCTLTLLRSTIRKSPLLVDGEIEPVNEDDARFDRNLAAVSSVVTSSGQNDSGTFELNLREERRLPFEGSGVESAWRLELPGDTLTERLQQFDYSSIADVVLHFRYTAREGGELLRKRVVDRLNERAATGEYERLLSVRHEFPTEWAKFNSVAIDHAANPQVLTAELKVKILPGHYPYWGKGMRKKLRGIALYAKTHAPITIATDPAGTANAFQLDPDPLYGASVYGRFLSDSPPTAPTTAVFNHMTAGFDAETGEFEFALYLDTNNNGDDKPIEDFWLVLVWGEDA